MVDPIFSKITFFPQNQDQVSKFDRLAQKVNEKSRGNQSFRLKI